MVHYEKSKIHELASVCGPTFLDYNYPKTTSTCLPISVGVTIYPSPVTVGALFAPYNRLLLYESWSYSHSE